VAILVRSRAGQAEAEAAASSQQLALAAAAAAAARSSFFVGKKIACGAVQVPVKKSPAAQGGAWVGLLKNEKRRGRSDEEEEGAGGGCPAHAPAPRSKAPHLQGIAVASYASCRSGSIHTFPYEDAAILVIKVPGTDINTGREVEAVVNLTFRRRNQIIIEE
jgi:hypothetical protein